MGKSDFFNVNFCSDIYLGYKGNGVIWFQYKFKNWNGYNAQQAFIMLMIYLIEYKKKMNKGGMLDSFT